MQFSIQYKIKEGRHRIPKIYGVYRRNALTLNQNFAQGIIKLSLMMFQMALNMMSQKLNITPSTTRQIYLTNVLILILVDGVLFPIYILWTLRTEMPEFYNPELLHTNEENSHFYVRQPILVPRDYHQNLSVKCPNNCSRNKTVFKIVSHSPKPVLNFKKRNASLPIIVIN